MSSTECRSLEGQMALLALEGGVTGHRSTGIFGIRKQQAQKHGQWEEVGEEEALQGAPHSWAKPPCVGKSERKGTRSKEALLGLETMSKELKSISRHEESLKA